MVSIPVSKTDDLGSSPRVRAKNARWCNGSTTDFGSVGPGSSPGRVTKIELKKSKNYFLIQMNFINLQFIKVFDITE